MVYEDGVAGGRKRAEEEVIVALSAVTSCVIVQE